MSQLQSGSDRVHLETLEVLHRLNLDLVAQRDPEAVLRDLLEAALRLCACDSGALYLRLEDGRLEPRWNAGVADQPELDPGAARLRAPLCRGDEVIGVLALFAQHEAWRSETDRTEKIGALERFAALASLGLEQMWLRDRLRASEDAARRREGRRQRVETIMSAALGEPEPTAALKRLIEGSAGVLECQGGVCLVEAETGRLEWLSDPFGLRAAPTRVGEGLIGAVAASGEALIVNDYPNWPGRLEPYVRAGLQSVVAVPMKRGDRVLSVVFWEHHEPNRSFDEADLALLAQVAAVATGLLEGVRLHQAVRAAQAATERKNALLETTHEISLELGRQHDLSGLLRLMLERAVRLLGATAGGVYLNEGAEIALVAAHGDELVSRAPLGYGVSGSVAARGEAMLLADYTASEFFDEAQPGVPWRSVLSVPLRRGGAVIGALTVADTVAPGRFGPEDLAALERFAALGGLALENTALLGVAREAQASSERQRQLLEALSEASLEVAAQLEPFEMLQRLTERARTVFGGDTGIVYLLDADGKHFRRAAWHGADPVPAGVLGEGLTGRVMADAKPQRVDDYTSWEGRSLHVPSAPGPTAAMSAPLMRGERAIGALTVARIGRQEPFSDADLETLERFAAFTSLALEKTELLEEARRANAATLAELAQLEALDAVSLQLLEQRSPTEVVRHTLRLLTSLVGAEAGAYWRYHPEDARLELSLTHNLPESLIGTRLEVLTAPTAEVIERGKPLLIADYQRLPGHNPLIPAKFHAMIFAPLVSNQRVIGLLTLGHREPDRFTARDLETARRFSDLGSVALENARLLEAMRRAETRASDRNALLEALHSMNLELGNYVRLQPLLSSILERAMLMLGGHHGRLYLVEPGASQLRLAAHIGRAEPQVLGLGQGVSGKAAESGQSLLVNDVVNDGLHWPEGHQEAPLGRSVISVPLKRGSEILGALTISDAEREGRYSALDIEALERFAATAALALEKAKLLEDTRLAEAAATERAQQLEALYQVSLELGGQLEFRQLLRSILDRAAQLLKVDAGGVFLNDAKRGDVVLAAMLGSHPLHRVKLGEGVSGRVAQSGETLLIADYATWTGRVQAKGTTWRSVASVPLRRGKSVVGALTLADTRQVGRFTAQDLEVLERFAALAGLALENARLYTRERQNLSDERIRLRITQDITRLQSVSETATALLETLNETLGYRELGLYSRDGTTLQQLARFGQAELPTALALTDTRIAGAVQTTKATLVRDPQLGRFALLPLRGRAGLLGTLHVYGDPDHSVGPTDLEMLEALGPAFSTALENATLHSQLEQKAKELENLRRKAERAARHDPLTKLRNRRAFEEDLEAALERYRRDLRPFGLAIMDLAGFKAVNDSLGHAAGDEALRRIARLLSGQAHPPASGGATRKRSSHHAYRIGGDEFAILIPPALEPLPLLHELVAAIKALEFAGDLRITPNIGLAICPTDTDNPDRLQSLADKRMYAAKGLGQSLLEGEALDNPPVPKRRAND